jgi:hypothetical protein
MEQYYDVYAKLEDPMGVLSVALGQWERRDDSKPQPDVRRAANTAMDTIDAMIAELHRMRSRLMDEMRDSDDATAARVDALLSRSAPACSAPARTSAAASARSLISASISAWTYSSRACSAPILITPFR